MNSEAYLVYQGMRARQRALDVLANNLANASTAGFKADRLLYRSVEAAQLEALGANGKVAPQGSSAASSEVQTPQQTAQSIADAAAADPATAREVNMLTNGTIDYSSGAMRQTGRSLDMAIAGDGLFAVQTARGERYTRAGSFTLDASGQLVTAGGDLVIGQNGGITIPPGELSVGSDGTISVDGRQIDRLKIVAFADPRSMLIKEGASLFAAGGGVRPREDDASRVEQGMLEGSNVNSITEMAAMIQNGREFESLQRSISLMMNDLGRKVSTELGRL